MRKITDFIVKFRYVFLVLFICLACFCLYLQTKVNINDDIMKYLPKNSETKIGNDIMNEEFSKLSTSNLDVMFKGLTKKEKRQTYEKLSNVKGVSSVKFDTTDEFNIGDYTLYKISVDDYSDSKLAKSVYERINENFKVEAMSGSIYDENKPLLQLWIVFLAIACALIILIILSDSWFEPFLFLISIGIAVFINKGTNIMFSSVSSITNAIVAVLQLALSMDYSIMLSNRFKQEKEKTDNKVEAMKEALYQSFKAISSSSLTTIVGLLALVFMSFTIGKDLGFILAKGVLLSLISIFFCLPALLLFFDTFLKTTKKKSFKFKFNRKLSKISYNHRHGLTFTIIGLFALAFMLKGSVQILYTDIQQDKVGQVFGSNNQIAIVYENKYSDKVNSYLPSLFDDENVSAVLSYDMLLERKLSASELTGLASNFSSSIDIDESLVKLVYYMKFDGTVHDNLSINDLIKTINSNDYLSTYVKKNYKISIADLTSKLNGIGLNDKIDVKTLSKVLNIEEKDLNLLYLFFNSNINYNNDWSLTAEELFLFIKDNVAENEYLTKFIPNDKKVSLLVSFNKVSNIKNIFVSDKYSRAVLNTTYKQEGKETYEFVKKLKENIGSEDGIYIVGVSPMAYEINKTFNSELNKITLITIVLIFIVVAFTFKSADIPFVDLLNGDEIEYLSAL